MSTTIKRWKGGFPDPYPWETVGGYFYDPEVHRQWTHPEPRLPLDPKTLKALREVYRLCTSKGDIA